MSARRFEGAQLVIASHNQGKVREISDLLGPFAVELISAAKLGLPEPEETGATYVENALLKAELAAKASGLPALADDSGLSVWALGGAPGIYSARWAGETKDFTAAMARVHEMLPLDADRSASFFCALALAWPDGHAEVVEGRVEGTLVWPTRGLLGFGYDPMFLPNGHSMTFGEMDPAAKHAISHRASAFSQLVTRCFSVPLGQMPR